MRGLPHHPPKWPSPSCTVDEPIGDLLVFHCQTHFIHRVGVTDKIDPRHPPLECSLPTLPPTCGFRVLNPGPWSSRVLNPGLWGGDGVDSLCPSATHLPPRWLVGSAMALSPLWLCSRPRVPIITLS